MAEPEPPGRRAFDDALGFTSLSRVRLDTLLHELLDRTNDVLASQERIQALLDAVIDISSDLELRRVLQRVVDAACELASARYGALGVLTPDRKGLEEFITHGVSDEERARIGPLPRGHGVLGLLITDPRPIRLAHISDHPRSYGFPPNHPPMDSFLGVPIRVHDVIYGNLYLAEKIGATEFTDLDEQIVTALSAAAGIAIDNARLYEVTERRRRWLQATTEISQALLGELERGEALRLIARRTREVSGSDVAALLLQDESGDLAIEVVEGIELESTEGRLIAPDQDTMLTDVLEHGVPVIVDDLAKEADAGRTQLPDELVRDLAHTLVVPFTIPKQEVGALLVANRRETPQFGGGFDADLIATFASQVALALQLVQAQADRALVAVLEDRDRIARDLHDLVIQRLFASGLQLHGTLPLTVRPEVHQRISGVVEDLDATIRDIRATIFELQYRPDRSDLRADIRGLAKEYAASLGFTPRVDLRGAVDSAVPPEIRPQLLAVVREMLSNAARHAQASSVTVEIDVRGDDLKIVVSDDGVGMEGRTRESGLRNLRERAIALNGSLEIRDNEPKGTVLEWRVPLRQD